MSEQKKRGDIVEFKPDFSTLVCCGKQMDYWTGQFLWICLECGMAAYSMSREKVIFEESPLYHRIEQLKAET